MEGIIAGEGVLENGLDALPVLVSLLARGNVPGLTLEKNLALGMVQQAQQNLGKGGLAGAGLAHDGDEFALVEIEAHIIDGDGLLVAKAEHLRHMPTAEA